MDQNTKRNNTIAAILLAGSGAVALDAQGANYNHDNGYSGVTPNQFDTTAPTIAIQDVLAFQQAQRNQLMERDANISKESDGCYTITVQGGATKQQSAAANKGKTKPTDKYENKSLQELLAMKDDTAKMPHGAERQAEEEAFQRALMAKARADAPQTNMGASFPGLPGGGGMGGQMGDALNKQMKAAHNPAIAQCLSEVETKYADKGSTRMQTTYFDPLFDDANKVLMANVRVAHVELPGGQRFNVVSNTGPYGAKATRLEIAIRSDTTNIAPSFETVPPVGQSSENVPTSGEPSNKRPTAGNILDGFRGMEGKLKGLMR